MGIAQLGERFYLSALTPLFCVPHCSEIVLDGLHLTARYVNVQ